MSITLWHFPLQGPADGALALLTEAERLAVRRFDRAELAVAFARRRAARRVLLACALDRDAAEVVIVEKGKPAIPDKPVSFSASHSGGTGILAIAGTQVGADVEYDRPVRAQALARGLLAPDERGSFAVLDDQAAQNALFRLWCGKEAVMKGVGEGLHLGRLPLIALPVAPGGSWHEAVLRGRMAEHGRWFVAWPHLGPGLTVAVAAPAPVALTVRDARPELARYGL